MFRRWLALVVLSAAGVMAAAGPATGGGGTVSFTFSPQSGPPGTVITVSGTGCATEVLTQVEVVLSTQGPNGTVIASGLSAVIDGNQQEGNWTVMLTVPLGTPPGTYDLQAFCKVIEDFGGDGAGGLSVPNPPNTAGFITYNPATFTIPAAPAAPPATAAPGTPTEPAPAPAEPAPPAPMVAATPRTAG